MPALDRTMDIGENLFKSRADENAARTVRDLDRSLARGR